MPDIRIKTIEEIRRRLMHAIAQGKREATLTLGVMEWLDVLDEIKDRHPRNYSALLMDDTLSRLETLADTLGVIAMRGK